MSDYAPRPIDLAGIERHIAFCHLRVRIERVRILVYRLLEQRQMKFPNLQGVGPALDKLRVEIEKDAETFIHNVEVTRARKQNTFDHARKALQTADSALSDVNAFLTDLEKATNGGPTSGDSPQSPVDAKPEESAGLSAVTGA